MDLSRSLVKKFSKSVTPTDNSNVETYIRGTIKVVGNKKFVQLDGSEQMTPISEVTDAQNGDRVLVTIGNHTATVIGNYTYPPSARTANEALTKADDAKDAAEKASINAQAASTAASEAKGFATESQTAAQEAKNLASEAIASASNSQQQSAEALALSTKASEDITAINSDIVTVKDDINKAKADLSGQITSNVEFFVANYATKTEVSTVEGDLTAEISKSVAELRTTMSENYVGKTDLVDIQASLQTQITQNAEGISTSASKIETLETDTADIQNAVLAAQTSANNAKAAADKAQADATAAATAASNAQKTADEADAALQIANTNLTEAKANLESVTSRVDATEEEIEAAQQAVSQAQTAVDKAQSDATAAQTAANNAKDAADSAQADATAAQQAVLKTQSDLESVTSRVTITETKAEQTANKFTWLVKSGTSATDFILTDRVAELTAQHINLNGLVTFSGLDSSVQNSVSTIESWTHTSDNTLIDGGKIYTGTITADKLNVTSLSAICATIGGFTIGADSLYNGVNAIMKANGVYLGIDGISCGDKFKVTDDGISMFRWYDEMNEKWLRITIGDDASPIDISSEDDPTEWLIIEEWGIHRATDKNLHFMNSFEFESRNSIGTFDHPAGHYYMNNTYHMYSTTSDGTDKVNLIYLSANDKIHIGADNMPGNAVVFHNNIAFDSRGSVGTETAPSGNHYMANARYIYALNTSSVPCQLIGINKSDDISIGSYSGTNDGVYLTSGYQKQICLRTSNIDNTEAVNLFSITYNSTLDKMVIYAPAINNNTTSSNSANLVIGSTGILYKYVSSSRRYKEAISETLTDSINPNRLYNLPVVEYIYKREYLPETDIRYRQKFIGFIAEDVENIYPLATNYDEDGRVESWSVNVMLPAMLKLIQDQHKVDLELSSRIDDSNTQIEHLRYQLEQAMLRIAEQQKEIDKLKMAG